MMRKPREIFGFSLVEVTLALGLFAVCMVAVLGLIPSGLNQARTTSDENAAASIARAVAVDLRNTPQTTPLSVQNSPVFAFAVPVAGSTQQTRFFTKDGTPLGTNGSNAVAAQDPRFRVTLQLSASAATTSQKTATFGRIFVTWPALADSSAATTPSKFSGSYESVVVLEHADMQNGN